MLQHSRINSVGAGEPEPVDINALVDEYFRLAYHGLRAKDKTFNATMVSDFDPSIGKINIVPQDIGRVILNLITNAFYAIHLKSQQMQLAQASDSSTNGHQDPKSVEVIAEKFVYQPTVTVTTKKLKQIVEISIKDNGPGIASKNLDKIFQPFFTTKPVGQGTGLGLSISYDIVRANNGSLKVVSREARPDDPFGQESGAEFIIQLPIL
jgi:two-component system NtrC family sensor kinase